MGTAAALAAYAVLLAVGAVLVWRRPVRALYAFVVGLALHNAAMAALFGLGLRGTPLTLVQAWKEVLLAVALAAVAARALRTRRLPFRLGVVDALALAFAGVVVLYALLPQDVLGGEADARGVLFALRHDLTIVGAFFLGRSLDLRDELRPLAKTVLATAAAVAAVGLVELYTVPIDWWRDAHVPDYFRKQLDFEYEGPRGLPENFVFNTGDEDDLLRRLVSTFLSPLGAAYLFVVALCLWAVRPARWWPLAPVVAVGLLFTFTRAAILALAGALVVLALVRRVWWPAAAAVATVAVGVAFAAVFPAIAPETQWTPAELRAQRDRAEKLGVPPGEALDLGEPSIRSHLTSLREGVETVAEHPQGYGLGNSGVSALRTDVRLKAGESTYTELGVDTGLVGALLFVAWSLALLLGLVRSAAGTAAAFAAVLALAVQTNVLGIPWLAFCVWILAGALVAPARLEPAWQSRSIRAPTSATST